MNYNGMYYEISGKGSPIIFIPGTGATHRMFSPQVSYFSRYFQTITLDLRGTGQSIPFKSINPWKYIKLHAESIIDLMHFLKIDEAIFVGVSYGGIIAQEIAKICPKRVEKLIIIDSYARTIPYSVAELKLALFGLGFLCTNLIPVNWIKPLYKYYSKWELAYSEILGYLENRKSLVLLLQLVGTVGLNNLNKIRKSKIPILAIVGDAAPLIVKMSEEIAKVAPKGQLVVVENAFDPSNLCNPNQVNESLLSFLENGIE